MTIMNEGGVRRGFGARALPYVFLFVGVCLLFVSLAGYAGAKKAHETQTASTTGTVVAVEQKIERERRNGHTTERIELCPTVEYSVDGRAYRHEGPCGVPTSGSELGARVDVRYNPAAPEESSTGAAGAWWVGPAVFAVVGLLFGGVSLGVILRRRRARSAR